MTQNDEDVKANPSELALPRRRGAASPRKRASALLEIAIVSRRSSRMRWLAASASACFKQLQRAQISTGKLRVKAARDAVTAVHDRDARSCPRGIRRARRRASTSTGATPGIRGARTSPGCLGHERAPMAPSARRPARQAEKGTAGRHQVPWADDLRRARRRRRRRELTREPRPLTARAVARRRRRGRRAGFTLIEDHHRARWIVGAHREPSASNGLRSSREERSARIRRTSSGAMRYLFDRASTTGKTHRLGHRSRDGRLLGRGHGRSVLRSARGRDVEADRGDARTRRRRGGASSAPPKRRRAAVRRTSALGVQSSSAATPRLELRPDEARRRGVPAQASALRGLQGDGPRPVTLNKACASQRLYTPRVDRAGHDGRRATSTSSRLRTDRGAASCFADATPRATPCSRWSPTRSRAACASTTKRSSRLGRPAERRRREPGRAATDRGAWAAARPGFTLLEVMIAIRRSSSLALVSLLSIVTNNIRATHHAKLTTVATFFARGKMVDLEDQVLENGFSNSDETA